MSELPQLSLFPTTAQVKDNHLFIGGCDTTELAAQHGTPLYIFDEVTLRQQCASFRQEFGQRHPDCLVIYASKAFLNRALASILHAEGLGLDVVSAGEMAIARSVNFPPSRVYFHGNNKTAQELQMALEWGIGRVVVDNFYELTLLQKLAQKTGQRQDILLRLCPGVDPHTHRFTTTGVADSKFGFSLPDGQAEKAVAQALAPSQLNLVGLHCHLGSPIFETEPYEQAIALLLEFAAGMKQRHGFTMKELSPGGGFAIQYLVEHPAPPIADYAQAIVNALHQGCQRLGLELPRLVIEPGRSIVGRAGVALYRTGASKEIPGVRKYVSLDGGMADNIRPALYEAKYEAVLANRVSGENREVVSLAGKYCESGDVLIKDIELPRLSPGDLIAVPASGAYCLAMASNYNCALKPAIILVREGKARLIRRRESFEDLMKNDVV